MPQYFSELSFQNLFGIAIAALPALLNLVLIFYLVFRMPQNRLTIIFTIFVFGLFIWQLGDVTERASRTAETAIFWGSFLSTGWLFVPAIAVHFCILYTRQVHKVLNAGILTALYGPTILFSAIYKSTALGREYSYLGAWGWNPEFYGTLDTVMLVWLSSLGLLALLLLVRYTIRVRDNKRLFLQSLIITAGLSIPTVQAIVTEVVFPIFFKIPTVPITSTTMSCFALAVVVSLKKYDLFSVSTTINAENILHNISDLVATFTPQGKLSYVNTYAAEELGISKGENLSYYLSDFFPPGSDNYKEFNEHVWGKVMEGGYVANYPTTLRAVNKEMTVLLSADPIYGARQLEGVLLVARNITELKKTQEELAMSAKRFQALIEKSSDCIVMIGNDGVIQYATPAVVDVLGFELYEYVGMNMFKIVHPESVDAVTRLFRDIMTTPGATHTTVLRARHKSGKDIWLEGSGTNLLGDPAVGAVVGNFRDITARHEAQSKLQKQNNELKRVNGELDNFIYSVSHDIKAPLKSILGITQIAMSETDNEAMLQYFRMIKQSVDRLNAFTQEVIEFSKDTRHDIKLERVNFNKVMKGILNDIRYLESAPGIDLQLHVEGNAEFITDKAKLTNILINLISNAIKYHDPLKERPYVRVGLRNASEEIVISIADNGEGIAPENHAKIFEMFCRMSSRSNGSGLGLYIVKETLNRLNGTISLRSQVGEGSEFELRLPHSTVHEETEMETLVSATTTA